MSEMFDFDKALTWMQGHHIRLLEEQKMQDRTRCELCGQGQMLLTVGQGQLIGNCPTCESTLIYEMPKIQLIYGAQKSRAS